MTNAAPRLSAEGEAGKVLDLRPTSLAAGGDAIARDPAGRVVFVTGALPGEQVRAEVFAESRDYLRARTIEVCEASPHRTAPPCPETARGCGCCQCQHVALDGQRALKQEIVRDALRRLGRVEAPVIASMVELSPWAFRTTLRAAVVDGRAGYRRSKQHTVVAVDSCAVVHPLVEDLLVSGRYGAAQEVVLRCGARTGERLAAPSPGGAEVTVPSDVRRDHLHEVVAGRTWRISARSFFQSRPDGAEALADLVAKAASEVGTGVAVDLYSGVGVFAGVLASRGWSVTSVESSKSSVADARANLRTDGVRALRADVDRWRPVRSDLVVANPSRKGLGTKGVRSVVGTGARRVVLVSCDVGSLGRDTHLLGQAGYGLTSVTPVDMFPHTFHVEVVSVFDR